MSAQVIELKYERIKRERELRIRNRIWRLFRSGVDEHRPLNQLLAHCRNPDRAIGQYQVIILYNRSLVEIDGAVSPLVKKVLLSGTFCSTFLW
jgi:hypothetical protein